MCLATIHRRYSIYDCNRWSSFVARWCLLRSPRRRLSCPRTHVIGLVCPVHIVWNSRSTRSSHSIAHQLQGNTSLYRKISWSLEAARFGFRLFKSPWNFRAIRPFKHPISWLRDLVRFSGKTSYCLDHRKWCTRFCDNRDVSCTLVRPFEWHNAIYVSCNTHKTIYERDRKVGSWLLCCWRVSFLTVITLHPTWTYMCVAFLLLRFVSYTF